MSVEDQGLEERAEDAAANSRAVKRVVLYGASLFILTLSAWALATPEGAGAAMGSVVGWISAAFGWYYFVVATLILVFVIFIAASRHGNIKLGPQHATPDFGLFGWGAMFFAAGIGIDLIFFSVAGPMAHYLFPPTGDAETVEAARQAVVWTLFHYGITGWAMYALMGMTLGYFAFRHGLPLAVRSALYPLIGRRVHGRVGDAVDLAAIIGTVFGVAVSLGIGVLQLNYGLNFMFGLPENVGVQIALIVVAVVVATASAVSGVERGIQRLSQLNVILALVLMGYVTVVHDPIFILNSLIMNIGDYLSRFPSMTLNTFAYDQPVEWLGDWTLFFWAWWIAWAPFVGLFLARISKGRTIRQFVVATLTVPFAFTLLFLAIFGNAALDLVRGGAAEFGQVAAEVPEQGFFLLLAEFPGVTFTAGLTIVVGLLLFVTSADSGALVMANLSSHLPTPLTDAAPWLRIFWASVMGVLTLAMLLVGGLDALQQATIIMGLPFSFVMLAIMWGLHRALRVESLRDDALRTSMPSALSERVPIEPRGVQRTWRQRLERAMHLPDQHEGGAFVDAVCRPAFEQVHEALRAQHLEATITEELHDPTGVPALELRVAQGDEQDFIYRVQPRETPVPSFLRHPVSDRQTYVRIEVFLPTGSEEYDVMGYDVGQLIGDILDQYERHLEYLRLNREAAFGARLPERLDRSRSPRPTDHDS
jgi:choline/glycine/proline betaine transport protein